ncbi:hypothetical protein OHU17_37300 (plasmid) [Streptomyces goshikiensis]|uniref:Lipopolysaccharide assembly protein A domain-containing protein n=1 Tax=Streptomyces goshikiensis TaxID=1942 RepID=A0ABZ1RXC7_9ACTN|nr:MULTISPECIES: hypothetical protein [Streptomyces]MBP0932383.1 hypothetical protein [Streptomyces sp. KCTC 0041BP]RPK29267.1 hypothetical protein EES37_34930 [Streptomyces sp. ADI91-18]WBY24424.1 hypothetical protein PET44_32605 [Streptomyces goshikiensis]WSS03801.1 hypothetical protein OG224_37750 [Streptomyces goshikiensis]WSY02912.1 hypothetical protein OG590_37505 [Streptomyces goshikiensis]
MILILGLIILIAALIVAVAGVMANLGSAHELTNDFSVFGYHVTSSTGALFLYGIAIGALALLGLALMLAGARRAARRNRVARRDDSIPSKRESAVVDREREDLIQQRDAARAETAQILGDDRPATAPVAGHRRAKWLGGQNNPR